MKQKCHIRILFALESSTKCINEASLCEEESLINVMILMFGSNVFAAEHLRATHVMRISVQQVLQREW